MGKCSLIISIQHENTLLLQEVHIHSGMFDNAKRRT